ncbi:DUF4062 domain-containing protein [Paenibacillus sp. IHBB 3054]|uniref:DUF4062 domain-containing protein n=1 Tax=Paenibacillus sp. IHBB 3054 TaxID=3425689 RepID=UPI003F6762F7
MDKRYQVFVSSTYQDLQDERKEIMQALLELDCIPSGMELFPATNDDQWTLIKSVIDDSDYYMVVIGGRYGSIGPSGFSYTEMEYRYALEIGKPIIAFIHKSPQDLPVGRSEQEKEGKEKLDAFKILTQKKLVKYWLTPSDLGSVVSRSLMKLIKSNPAIGWVRGDQVPAENATKEILKLKNQIEELKNELSNLRVQAPDGSKDLSQGLDEYTVTYTCISKNKTTYDRKGYKGYMDTSWNRIFSNLGPVMLDEADEATMKKTLNSFIRSVDYEKMLKTKELTNHTLDVFEIDETVFQTIKVQLRALGLIMMSKKSRSVKDTNTYWSLTPYGDEILTKLRAIKR